MKNEIKIDISNSVLELITSLEQIPNSEFYLVGGVVRDAILGRKTVDVDVATNVPPSIIREFFNANPELVERYSIFGIGEKYGTLGFVDNHTEGQTVEITTYRADGAYLDSRHPENVTFSTSILEDLSRRDFTMNAIAVNALDPSEIIDPFFGIEDIKNGIIRTVGVASERFSEDGLRVLRGFRFCAQLGFTLDEKIREAAREAGEKLVKNVKMERVKNELEKILTANTPEKALTMAAEDGVLQGIFATTKLEIVGIDRLCPIFPLRLAYLLQNAKNSNMLLSTLRLTKKEQEQVAFLLKNKDIDTSKLFENEYILAKSINNFSAENLQLLLKYKREEDFIARLAEFLAKTPAIFIEDLKISGAEIMEILEIAPGSMINRIKTNLLHKVWEEQTLNDNRLLREILKTDKNMKS